MSLEHKWIYLFYIVPCNCYKDVDQKSWFLQPPLSRNLNATDQHPPQSSWSALSPIHRSNPTVTTIKITVTNIPMKLYCNVHLPHHQHLFISVFAFTIIINITITIASSKTSLPAKPSSPHSSSLSSSSLSSKPPPSLPPLSSSFFFFFPGLLPYLQV